MIERTPSENMSAASSIKALEIIRAEFDTSMMLCGLHNLGEIARNSIPNPY